MESNGCGGICVVKTKSFRETMKENNANFKKGMQENKEKTQKEKAVITSEYKNKQGSNKADLAEAKANQPNGYERTRNTLVKGFALWLAIPVIVVILIVGLLIAVGTWDWIVGLFN